MPEVLRLAQVLDLLRRLPSMTSTDAREHAAAQLLAYMDLREGSHALQQLQERLIEEITRLTTAVADGGRELTEWRGPMRRTLTLAESLAEIEGRRLEVERLEAEHRRALEAQAAAHAAAMSAAAAEHEHARRMSLLERVGVPLVAALAGVLGTLTLAG